MCFRSITLLLCVQSTIISICKSAYIHLSSGYYSLLVSLPTPTLCPCCRSVNRCLFALESSNFSKHLTKKYLNKSVEEYDNIMPVPQGEASYLGCGERGQLSTQSRRGRRAVRPQRPPDTPHLTQTHGAPRACHCHIGPATGTQPPL